MRLAAMVLSVTASGMPAATVLIDNTTGASIASGDRANLRGFAFRPNAGGAGPASALPATVYLESITLHRPGFSDATTPQLGATAGFVTDANTPVYLKIYSSWTGGLTGADLGTFLGSSTNGVTWNEVDGINGPGVSTATAAPFESYTYTFPAISLDRDTTYWMVFSETNDSSVEVSQFRVIVEPGTGAAGSGYLADTIQVRTTTGAASDWGVYFNANVNTVPEPSTAALGLLGAAALLRRRRR